MGLPAEVETWAYDDKGHPYKLPLDQLYKQSMPEMHIALLVMMTGIVLWLLFRQQVWLLTLCHCCCTLVVVTHCARKRRTNMEISGKLEDFWICYCLEEKRRRIKAQIAYQVILLRNTTMLPTARRTPSAQP